ncbi:MAG: hypothetical protein AAGF95_31965 [Chloroflexota bacterium]
MTALHMQFQRSWSWLRTHNSGFWVLIVLFVCFIPLANPRVYATDEVQYYVHLRSLWFDGDLDFANDYREFHERNPFSGIDNSLLQPDRVRDETGLFGNIAPVGSAILWAPFFVLADVLVRISNAFGANISADGYSWPYIYAVCYASALYGLLGLLLCYRLTRRYASSFATTVATMGVWLATPLVFYMFIQMPFAHANGFFLVSLFITIWHETRGQRRWQAWVGLGSIGGLMVMTREQLGLFLLLPAIEALVLYWNILLTQADRWLRTARLFATHVLFLAVFVLSLAPQFAVYQVLNGSPLPAGEVSGKLNWCSPHMIDTLVDYDPRPSVWCNVGQEARQQPFAHGAFLWSPILGVALLGLIWLWSYDRLLASLLFVAFMAQVYVNGAFGSTWHLTASFGFRRLIECTPIFIVGLALLIDRIPKAVDRRWSLLPILVLIVWNFGLLVNWAVFHPQLREGLVWPDLWFWQLEAPQRLLAEASDILFNRDSLLENPPQ